MAKVSIRAHGADIAHGVQQVPTGPVEPVVARALLRLQAADHPQLHQAETLASTQVIRLVVVLFVVPQDGAIPQGYWVIWGRASDGRTVGWLNRVIWASAWRMVLADFKMNYALQDSTWVD